MAQTVDVPVTDLLSQLERLRYRAIDRWGGQPYLDAVDVYEEGDRAYLDRNYRLAGEKYREAIDMLEPFFDQIDTVFEETLASAKAAFENGDAAEAVRLFDLAVSITPGNRDAETGFERAKNLDSVLSLMDQGLRFETDLEFDAAKLAFERALEIDALWEPAAIALERAVVKRALQAEEDGLQLLIYSLLAAVVDQATDEGFEHFRQRVVLAPVGAAWSTHRSVSRARRREVASCWVCRIVSQYEEPLVGLSSTVPPLPMASRAR